MNATETSTLELLRQTRRNIHGLLTTFDAEQQNKIPTGFNNNLIWNAGHVIATSELLTFGLCGVKTPSDRTFIDRYRKGSRPVGRVEQAEIDTIAERLLGGVDTLAAAVAAGTFRDFTAYQTSFGVRLTSISEALAFNNMHEAMHFGTLLALRRLV